jgi:hypothetical protein
MASVFTPAQKWNGSFRSDKLKLKFDGVGPGLLVQQMNFNYQQMVQMLFEVGESNIYYVGGHAQGQVQMSRIVGPGKALGSFFTKYGDICQPGACMFEAQGGCGNAEGGVTYRLEHCILNQVGAGVTAQEIVITENIGMMFANLDVSPGSATGGGGGVAARP